MIKSNIFGTPLQISVMVICRGNLLQLFAVGFGCRDFHEGICRDDLLWLFAVAICH